MEIKGFQGTGCTRISRDSALGNLRNLRISRAGFCGSKIKKEEVDDADRFCQ